MSRIDNSRKSVTVGAVGLLVGYLLNFIARRVFVHYLSIEYLGLNGLFFNIFSLLTFAELGIGTAITYSLYRPLATGDTELVKSLMGVVRKTNYVVGSFVLVVGLSMTPFLFVILKEAPDIPRLKVYYALYIIDAGVGYFLGHKRLILYADQKKYVDSAYRYGFEVGKYALQIALIVLTRSYLLYLLVVLFKTIIENLLITRRINRIYPCLTEPVRMKLPKVEVQRIRKNVVALASQKAGTIVVSGTDNILIVRFVDLASAGIYGGYYMLVIAISNVIGMFNTSILASIGNLVVEENEETYVRTFVTLDFFIGWLVGFCSISLFILLNPFIDLWLGPGYTFPMSTVFVIVLNFYLTGVLSSVRTFTSSMGLFWQNRYKPIFEALINLFASIWLAGRYGVIGVFIGTSLSSLLTSSWFEPYILFRHGLKKPVRHYFMRFIIYAASTLLIGWATWKVGGYIRFSSNLATLVALFGVCAILPNLLYLGVSFRRPEFSEIVSVARKIIGKKKKE
ncbi:MAG: hypothetical protein GX911_01195 [Spirochaetales bacterium]|nr:hypothetical protein [Spirochaetales bacterium]